MTSTTEVTLSNIRKLCAAHDKLEQATDEVNSLHEEVRTNIHDLAKEVVSRLQAQGHKQEAVRAPHRSVVGWVLWHNPCDGKQNHGYKLIYDENSFWMVDLDAGQRDPSIEYVTHIGAVNPDSLNNIRLLMDILNATTR